VGPSVPFQHTQPPSAVARGSQGALRLGRSFTRPDGVVMTNWYHPACLLDVSKRAKTWSVERAEDLHGARVGGGSSRCGGELSACPRDNLLSLNLLTTALARSQASPTSRTATARSWNR
jgi:hypothetical protein